MGWNTLKSGGIFLVVESSLVGHVRFVDDQGVQVDVKRSFMQFITPTVSHTISINSSMEGSIYAYPSFMTMVWNPSCEQKE